MNKQYPKTEPYSSLKPPAFASLARRKLKRAYALSDSRARLIAELQGYGTYHG